MRLKLTKTHAKTNQESYDQVGYIYKNNTTHICIVPSYLKVEDRRSAGRWQFSRVKALHLFSGRNRTVSQKFVEGLWSWFVDFHVVCSITGLNIHHSLPLRQIQPSVLEVEKGNIYSLMGCISHRGLLLDSLRLHRPNWFSDNL